MRQFVYLLSILLCSIVFLNTHSFAFEQNAFFKGYVRSNFQVGEGFVKGQNLHTGFMPAQRLQEGQYFEIGFAVQPLDTASFHFLLANGGDTFHYTDSWGTDVFSVRELYLSLQNKAENPDYRLWAGSRMYRGDDLHFYDIWILDNHNLLGLGVELLTLFPFELEVAVGAKMGFGGNLGNLNLDPNTSVSYNKQTQRYIFIIKPKFRFANNMALKFNIEFQAIPAVLALYTEGGIPYSQQFPDAYGFMVGPQLSVWSDTCWRNIFINFGNGDIVGGITTPYVLDVSFTSSPAGGSATVSTRSNSSVLRMGTVGNNEFGGWSLMTGLLLDWYLPRNSSSYVGVNISARPIVYLSDQWHVGLEATLISYLKKRPMGTTDVSHIIIVPMIKYAMSRDFFGVPTLYLRFSNAFYFQKVVKYNTFTNYAFNISAGFELWF